MAWIRATHPDPKFRDGRQAVILALRAVELSPGDAAVLDTLAAAYAEAGRFAEAARTARKAMDIAVLQNKPALAASMPAKIRLYQAGKPFHELPACAGRDPDPTLKMSLARLLFAGIIPGVDSYEPPIQRGIPCGFF